MFKTIIIASATLAAISVGANAATVCNPAVQNWMNGSKTTCTVVDQNSNNQQGQNYSQPKETRPETETTNVDK
ncbi:hypothetical protein [Aestuariivirga sp.]|uniref:hypothetical protein n=1 Tax=Aestuariivirga sp. TaxID=2650926 RepID=UPI0039E3694F